MPAHRTRALPADRLRPRARPGPARRRSAASPLNEVGVVDGSDARRTGSGRFPGLTGCCVPGRGGWAAEMIHQRGGVNMLSAARIRIGVTSVFAAVAVGGVVLIGANNGSPVQDVRLLSGTAWFSSAKVGQLTLLDGTSA